LRKNADPIGIATNISARADASGVVVRG